ncbi:hypothetical protein ACFQFH_12660 [Halobaculum halobium]|uniref:Uncharacterized protein n=1 Tax=Halobaculum halobium TaxID=3032281 RepID=A0ABD5TBQ3_9EURY|nr:hypothetical protein [Halobaculum sp. SYNS20]
MSDTSPRSSSRPSSLRHLLAVWLLVGASFFGLGAGLARATLGYDGWAVGTLALSGWDVGLLLATAVVCGAWVAGIRPSIRAGVGYLIVELVVHLIVALALSWARLGAWATVAARAVSIPVAAVVCFTPLGGAAAAWVRERARRLLGVPPTE